MKPFLDAYDKMTRIVDLRYRDWSEAAETTDALEPIQAPARSPRPIQTLAAWLTSHVHPAPLPQQPRRRPA